MIPKDGAIVRAQPHGWDQRNDDVVLTDTDPPSLEGIPSEIVGVLSSVSSVIPGLTVYLVREIPVDPSTIKEVNIEEAFSSVTDQQEGS